MASFSPVSRYLIRQPDAPAALRGSIDFGREHQLRVGDLIPTVRRPRPLTWWRVAAVESSCEDGWDGVLHCVCADPMPLDLDCEAAVWLP